MHEKSKMAIELVIRHAGWWMLYRVSAQITQSAMPGKSDCMCLF